MLQVPLDLWPLTPNLVQCKPPNMHCVIHGVSALTAPSSLFSFWTVSAAKVDSCGSLTFLCDGG